MRTVWQHDNKFRIWIVEFKDIEQYQLSTLVLHPNYQDYKPEIVVRVRVSSVDMEDKLKPLKDDIVGFKLRDGNLCKDLFRAGYEKLKRLTIYPNATKHPQDLFKLIMNSSTTLVSLHLHKVDLSMFTGLQDNFMTLYNLKIDVCVNEEGLATLINCSRASLKGLRLWIAQMNLVDVADQLKPFNRLSELDIHCDDRDVFDE